MAAETTEEQRKAILPFLQRAEEIDRVEPKMAYYCRMYAVEQGLALEKRSAQIDGLLGALLSKLEKDKPALKLGAPADDAGECETFALRVFARADKADRAGRADKGTATAFYAASVFMEILNQFGPLSSDVAEAQRYAAWKAADIRKALREGRKPLPGPPSTWGDGSAGAGGGGGAAPAAAAAAAGDLPSPPTGLDRSDSALGTGPGGDLVVTLAPPRFAPGDAVFYCPDGHGPPARGVVTGGPFPPEGLGHTYALTLVTGGGGGGGGQAVRAFEVQLAPDVAAGAAVTLGPLPPAAPGPGLDGSAPPPPPKDAPPPGPGVVEGLVDPSSWRPAYRVKPEGGKKAVVVSDTRLAAWPRGGDGPASASAPPPFAAPRAPPPPPGAAAAAAAPPSAPPAPPPPTTTTATPAAHHPSLAALAEAQKQAKSAASSIAFEDVGTAVKCLREALRLLTVEGAEAGKK